ncbi:MAG: P1 family peptidase, partial [Pseudomonadota bacterium]|nr:P1 family peptidase [Pseudomonadota bacterium]
MHVGSVFLALLLAVTGTAEAADRPRAREAGITFGILAPGPLNAITDVAGVKVGHVTLIEGANIRTGVTAILPHGGNLYQDKVPAGFAVGNAYGKFMGSTQIKELGEIEAPMSEAADVLVLCGDLTNFGKTSEAEILAEDIRMCTIPVLGVLG